MAGKQKKNNTNPLSTEEKIKEAARKVFTRKGYAAARTRDIAEEAGINLALLNYYFRSKEKLFQEVMAEKMQELFGVLAPVVNDPSTTLETKLEQIAVNYIDTLSKNPDLPIFVLSEIRNNGKEFINKFPVKKLIRESVFVEQLKKARPDISPFHFIMSLLGMALFPFVGRPVFQAAGALDDKIFAEMMEERKTLLPLWLKAMIAAT